MSEMKTPLSRTMPLYVRSLIQQELDKQGKALPAIVQSVNGSIVTVNFQVSGVTLPVVEMPLFGPEYIRYPIQVGDKGVCFPADVYIGSMSGLGTGTADMSQRGNLATLVFFPIGNKNWSASDDAQSVVIYGPNGVILRDTNSETVQTIQPGIYDLKANTTITVAVGGVSIVVNSGGITIDGVDFLSHTHSGVTTGSGITGPVVP